jgi:hypothetical protein
MSAPTRRPGIVFGAGVPWAAVSQLDARAKARNKGTGVLAVRVYFAAVGWGNQIGHAEFASGDLAEILGTGAQGVTKAIRAAKDAGLVDDLSSARCLVLSGWHFQKSGHGTGACAHHGTNPRR